LAGSRITAGRLANERSHVPVEGGTAVSVDAGVLIDVAEAVCTAVLEPTS
jgi:hypothetical protein